MVNLQILNIFPLIGSLWWAAIYPEHATLGFLFVILPVSAVKTRSWPYNHISHNLMLIFITCTKTKCRCMFVFPFLCLSPPLFSVNIPPSFLVGC